MPTLQQAFSYFVEHANPHNENHLKIERVLMHALQKPGFQNFDYTIHEYKFFDAVIKNNFPEKDDHKKSCKRILRETIQDYYNQAKNVEIKQ